MLSSVDLRFVCSLSSVVHLKLHMYHLGVVNVKETEKQLLEYLN